MSGIIGAGAVRKSGIIGAFPDGHVIQVKQGTTGVSVQSGGANSATWGDTAGIPSVTITPTDASNKVFLTLTIDVHSAAHTIYVDFYRSISGGATTHNLSGETAGLAYSGMDYTQQVGICYLDSPSTTSAITYKGSFRSAGGSQVVYFGHGAALMAITAWEIVA